MEFEKENTFKDPLDRGSLFNSLSNKLGNKRSENLSTSDFDEFYIALKEGGHPNYMNWMSKNFWQIVYESFKNNSDVTDEDIMKVVIKECVYILNRSLIISFGICAIVGLMSNVFFDLMYCLLLSCLLGIFTIFPLLIIVIFRKYKRFYSDCAVSTNLMVSNFLVSKEMRKKGVDVINTQVPGE